MQQPIVVIDHPLLATGLVLLLQQNFDREIISLPPEQSIEAPSDALLLIELLLPDDYCGLIVAHHLLQTRPDLTPLLWCSHPAPLYVWAASGQRIPGFLDKAMSATELLQWIRSAINNGTAWPRALLAQARAWETDVAWRLRALNKVHWSLWLGMVQGATGPDLTQRLGLSGRTLERRRIELLETLGVENREAAVRIAWQWQMMKQELDGTSWSDTVKQFLVTV